MILLPSLTVSLDCESLGLWRRRREDMTKREEQRLATRREIVSVAADLLIARGAAGTTTVEVQRAARLSRGALLHHFPSREELLTAAVSMLVQLNEEAARQALDSMPGDGEPVARAVNALAAAVTRPAFAAEMDLWAAARSDPKLRAALQHEEKNARGDLYRVVDAAFGPELAAHPSYARVASLTVQFLRGLALTQTLRDGSSRTDQLIEDWSAVVRATLESDVLPVTKTERRRRSE